MSDSGYQEKQGFLSGFGAQLTSAIKLLLILHVGVFFVQLLCSNSSILIGLFGMIPRQVFEKGWIWQPLTGLFLHASLWALLMNLLVLWFFAPEVEFGLGGGRNFLWFYFSCGVISNLVAALLGPQSTGAILGPGGAVFGILTAYAVLFPHRVITLLLFFVLPVQMKAKYLAVIFGGIEWFSLMEGRYTEAARYASLAGILVGYVLVKSRRGREFLPRAGLFSRMALRVSNRIKKDREEYIRQQIDPILEKISRDGIQSLSWRERRVLKKAPRHIKPK